MSTKISMAEIRELTGTPKPDIAYELVLSGNWEIHDRFVSTDSRRIDEKREEWFKDARMNRNLTIYTYRWENGERIDQGYVTIY